ncbi:MAG TPA: hypothetical protein VNU97_16215 [Rhizomicrobium sp.]|nr:hypothetical protein [Rhizomicrobium sp.]
MSTPKERLCHLLELAAQGPQQRAALAGEVADLLLDWPAQYPQAMRATFGALLEKIVREVEPPACALLAARFEGREDFPLSLLNEFFLFASPQMKDAILARNDAAGAVVCADLDAQSLLTAARAARGFAGELARIAAVPDAVAEALLADTSSRGLAVLAKGAGVNRATFSAVAILAGPARSVHENFAMLGVFDRVPHNGAAQLVAFWRARCEGAAAAVERAA